MPDIFPEAPVRALRHLRLDTLVRLRWLAIAGQSLAVAGVHSGLGFSLPFGWCFVVIAVSAWLNIALRIRFPLSHRLREGAATALLAFDILQLAALLYLTGGLQNPFSILFLAPVMISATALPPQRTLVLGLLAMGLATLLSRYHLPLPWAGADRPVLPAFYQLGNWVALVLGLAFTGSSKFIADRTVRDALARVVDRTAFAAELAFPGWRTSDYPLPGALELNRQPSAPAWMGRAMTDRVASARQIIARWSADNGEPPMLRIALPDGAGASILFIRLARDFGQLGIRVDRVAPGAPADLRLIDEVAPFDSALWYLSRLDCAARVLCDVRASALLAAARKAGDAAEQARLLGEAEELTVEFAGYIPLGAPIRWAMASRRLTGFQASPRGIHPLNRLIATPN